MQFILYLFLSKSQERICIILLVIFKLFKLLFNFLAAGGEGADGAIGEKQGILQVRYNRAMFTRLRTWAKQDSIRHTLRYYLLFTCLGLGMAVTGPTLPALADQTGVTLATAGLLFLTGSGGYTLGTFVSGRVFDRARGNRVMGAAQIVSACMLALIPFAPRFWLLALISVLRGLADGFVNTGANTLLSWTHGEKVGPFMNALHFFFGLGAFLSPLLVAQVIGLEGGYRWAYLALATFALLAGTWVFILPGSPRPAQEVIPQRTASALDRTLYLPILAAMFYLFFYVGAEITFGGWIYTYATTSGVATPAAAAYLTSVFWLSFTIGRLLSIPAGARIPARRMIPIAVSGGLLMLAMLIALPSSHTVLWLATAGTGFFMAPVWPTGFTLAGQSIPLSGRVSALILLGDSFGGMILPTLVGRAMTALGAGAMTYLVATSLALTLLAFAFLARARPRPMAMARNS